MKPSLKFIATVLLAILTGSALGLVLVEVRKTNEIMLQNGFLQQRKEALDAQNDLLRENKMCIAFEHNRPDKFVVPPMQ